MNTKPNATQTVRERAGLQANALRLRARLLARRARRQFTVWSTRAFRQSRVLLYSGSRDRRVWVGCAVLLGVGGASSYTWWQTCGFATCPTVAELREWRPSTGDRLMAHDGELLGMIDPVRRIPVSLDKIPAHVREAFIAVEDKRYRSHHGIDVRGVVRAAVNNVAAGGVREGASTITMQLARNAFLTESVRGWKRKALEVRYTGLIEDALSKDEILERYLNTIYFGNGTWGIEAASRDLLGYSVSRATITDAALLAGLPKAPSALSPRRNEERARARRDVVLGVLVDAELIDSATAAHSRGRAIKLPRRAWKPDWPAHSWAVDVVRATLDSLVRVGTLPQTVQHQDLTIHTTIDVKAQRSAERAVAAGAARVDKARRNSESKPTEAALVAIDPLTGAVRAIAGGRAVTARGFNRATTASRQVGSTFKPFVYAAAVAKGYAGNRMLSDEPLSIRTGRTTWTPTNYGGGSNGRMTMRTALVRSSNLATVRLAQDVGNDAIMHVARANGVTSDLPNVPSLALGSASLTPLELTVAYAPFANGGWRVVPHVVTRVEAADGTLLWERAPSTRHRAMSIEDAFLVTHMLRAAVDEGTGNAVREYGVRGPVAGKTGTTNDGADAWFVGYSPSLVTSVWLGTDTPTSLGAAASGGRYAAPVWAQFMRQGWRSPLNDRAWTPPPTLVSRTVDANTGLLTNDWCGEPQTMWFKPGSEPTKSCDGGWFRFANSRFEDVSADAIDAAMNALGDAIGQGEVRQSLLQRIGDEFKRNAREVQRRAERERDAERRRDQRPPW